MCYLNAALALIAYSPPLHAALERLDPARECRATVEPCVQCRLPDVLANMRARAAPASNEAVKALCEAAWGKRSKARTAAASSSPPPPPTPLFRQGVHHDAHELLLALLCGSCLPNVTDAFTAETATQVACSVCKTIASTSAAQPDFGLTLSIPRLSPGEGNTSVAAALNLFLSEEAPDGAMCDCAECQGRRIATTRTVVMSAPALLVVQLKRFTNRAAKIGDFVEFDRTLALPVSGQGDEGNSVCDYRLRGVVVHSGDALDDDNENHFYAYVVVREGNGAAWYKVDDHIVDRCANKILGGGLGGTRIPATTTLHQNKTRPTNPTPTLNKNKGLRGTKCVGRRRMCCSTSATTQPRHRSVSATRSTSIVATGAAASATVPVTMAATMKISTAAAAAAPAQAPMAAATPRMW
jgi:hypothetical protein